MRACLVAKLSLTLQTLWAVACWGKSLSMGFSRQEQWSKVAISSSRGSSQPRDRNCVYYVSCISRCVLYQWATREVHRDQQCPLEFLGITFEVSEDHTLLKTVHLIIVFCRLDKTSSLLSLFLQQFNIVVGLHTDNKKVTYENALQIRHYIP